MKLLSSFKKELILASRGFYFYIEFLFAFVILAVLLFAIPEHSNAKTTEYLYFDLPEQGVELFRDEFAKDDLDGKPETVEVEAGDQTFEAELFVSEQQDAYLLNSEEEVRTLADINKHAGVVIELDENNELFYRYYFQGYESERLRNLMYILHNESLDVLKERLDNQEVVTMSEDYQPLNDRENAVPPLMAFSGSLMGMFIMASYIFLDKKEGVIKAYAVTASSVATYLMSKVFVILFTSVASALIITLPIMGFTINYGLLLLLVLTSGFFASALGLLIASFYKDLMKAFSVIYLLVIVMMLPSIAYFIPSWNPVWVRLIPTYPMLQGFREIMLTNGDAVYTLLASAGFLAAGAIVFFITNIRFRRTLSA